MKVPALQQQLRAQAERLGNRPVCLAIVFIVILDIIANNKAIKIISLGRIEGLSLSYQRSRRHITSTATAIRSTSPRRRTTKPPTMTSTTISQKNDDGNDVIEDPLVRYGFPSPLILGSGSYTRKLILGEMNVRYHKIVREIDERGLGDRNKDAPSDLVLRLANAKMDHLIAELVAGRCDDELPTTITRGGNGYIVLTADQVVTCNGSILEKPLTLDEAKGFVRKYFTHPPSTVGSCVIHHVPSNHRVSGVDTATIHFHRGSNSNKEEEDINNSDDDVADKLIDALIADGQPVMSCAGGLMVEHPLVQQYINRINGTQDSVMGLSKDLVLRLLQKMSTSLTSSSASRQED